MCRNRAGTSTRHTAITESPVRPYRCEAERRDKLEQRTQLTAQLEAHREDECAADRWLNLIRDYSQLEELDRPTLLRLAKRIEVGEKYQVDGETHRDIKIYCNFVGHIEL